MLSLSSPKQSKLLTILKWRPSIRPRGSLILPGIPYLNEATATEKYVGFWLLGWEGVGGLNTGQMS